MICEAGHRRRGVKLGDVCGTPLHTDSKTPQSCKGRIIEDPETLPFGPCSIPSLRRHPFDGVHDRAAEMQALGASLAGWAALMPQAAIDRVKGRNTDSHSANPQVTASRNQANFGGAYQTPETSE